MTKFYNPQRTRNIYDPASKEPFKLSRSKLDLFLNCPRCFYNDRRLGIGLPPGYPFALNSAVDALLKKEFDHYRQLQKPHPIMLQHQIDAVPFAHELIEDWRNSLHKGIQYHDRKTNLIITGGVDDVWKNAKGELIIVDYKATSKNDAITIDADWQIGYKRQMSLYAWLFKQNGFSVHHTGYFVYCNGLMDRPKFDQRLEFHISVLPYQIDDSWVEDAIKRAHECLNQ
ncbi:MAG: PD-(D/E)XK nuclease family protein, partial [Bdellovibrionota bacterium]